MSTERNREIVTNAMNAVAHGDSALFIEIMHDEFTFRPMAPSRKGTWADSYSGKENVIVNFYRKWFAQMEERMVQTITNVFVDGDTVIVESKGRARMKSGEIYTQNYCMVMQMDGGRIRELREYFDSGLADALFEKV